MGSAVTVFMDVPKDERGEVMFSPTPAPAAKSAAGGDGIAGGLTPAERKEALAALPGPPQRALGDLERALSAKGSVSKFLDAFCACEEALGAQCPPLDKKRERAAIEKARTALRAQLATENEPGAVLHLCVLLLHIDLNAALLEAPGRLLSPLIEALASKMPPEAYGALLEYHKAAMFCVIASRCCDLLGSTRRARVGAAVNECAGRGAGDYK